MTVNPSRSAAPSWLRVGAGILLAAVGLGTAVPAVAATPSPVTSSQTGSVSLVLSPYANGIVRADHALTVAVTVDNSSATAVGTAHVTLQLGATPLTDRESLGDWLDGGTDGVTLSPVGTVDVEAVPAAATRSASISVSAADPQLAGRAPGVYPLLASYPGDGGPVSSTSVMVVPADTGATPAGLVVPITAAPMGTGLLTAAQLTDLTAPGGDLTAQLDAVAGSTAILAVDPALPAAIRALGTSAPTSATAWLDRLDALPNSRFALQFGDADIAVQLMAGRSAPAQPTSLSAYLRPIDFARPAGTTPTPAPSGTAGPTLPSTDELLDVEGVPGVLWPASGTAGPDAITALGALGTDADPTLTLLASTSTAAGAAGGTVTARASAGGAALLVYDGPVSAALRDASRVNDPALRGAPLAVANAYLAFATADAAGRPLLLAVDRAVDRTAAGLAAVVDAVDQAPGLDLVPFGQLQAAAPVEATVVDAPADEQRVAVASALFSSEDQLGPLSTVLADPTLLTGPERAEILQLLGNGWRDRPDEWNAAVEAHRTRTAATQGAVEILDPTPVNLAGSGAPLGIWVRNDLPYPVEVTLVVTPDDPRLTVQRTTAVSAPAASNTRVKVPVEARVGNGEVTLRLELRSSAGVVIGPVRTVDVSVRAEWEGLGIAVLSVIVGALVVFGLIRTVLRRRRAKAADAARDAPSDPDDSSEHPAETPEQRE
jgi:hypothetical protein